MTSRPLLLQGYRRLREGTQPSHLHPSYVSSVKRAPSLPLVPLPHTLSEITGPTFESLPVEAKACDFTQHEGGAALGERIIVHGRVVDEDGRPLTRSLVEIWQANSAGRYLHGIDQHEAPLDPHFAGAGRLFTDDEGRYRLLTIRPGAYPWTNHANAWRPAHIHFSVFGPAFATRLVTQMYFPGDPLLPHDPIFNCTADRSARERLISHFDWGATVPGFALGYRFDIVLAGRDATPLAAEAPPATTWQTVGPFYSLGMGWMGGSELAPPGVTGERVTVSGRVIDGNGEGVPDAVLEVWQANSYGRYAHPEDGRDRPLEPGFSGYGRVPTDQAGRFRFSTIRPGPVPAPSGADQASHFAVTVLARGLMRRLVTRMYFPDDPTQATDFALGLVEAGRRGTLVARRSEASRDLEWNVRLQGPGETVFFDC